MIIYMIGCVKVNKLKERIQGQEKSMAQGLGLNLVGVNYIMITSWWELDGALSLLFRRRPPLYNKVIWNSAVIWQKLPEKQLHSRKYHQRGKDPTIQKIVEKSTRY